MTSLLLTQPISQEVDMKRDAGNHPCYTFPAIKTTRTMDQRVQKILDELKEYQEADTPAKKDEEAVDVLHAVETFLRGQFAERDFRLTGLVGEVYRKNKNRGYYDESCF